LKIGNVEIGDGRPLALISGLNVLESESDAIACAVAVLELARRHRLPAVFKASFDKANRTRFDGFRGPGLDAGLEMLAKVKAGTGLPVLTDVHESWQAERVAEVADCLQVPAFLCRQTDLLRACAETGRAVNLKKGQFVAGDEIVHAVDKLRSFGAADVMVTERGNSFGHRDLVVDFRGFESMRTTAPVCFDATHSAQQPGAKGGASAGLRAAVAPLARAAVAVGIDALFVEIHPEPARAPVDADCQLTPHDLDALLGDVVAIDAALRAAKSTRAGDVTGDARPASQEERR